MNNIEVDLSKIVSQLRKEGVTGVIYYVNPERGNNAFDGQSAEFPLQTLDAALALCVNYRHDAIICFTNNNTTMQFNAGGVGCWISKDAVTIYGVNYIAMDNINGAATRILQCDAHHIRITGVRFLPVLSEVGVTIGGYDHCEIDHCKFIGCNGGVWASGNYNDIHHNQVDTMFGAAPYGLGSSAASNKIRHNTIMGSNIAASVGVDLNATSTLNFVYDNIIEGVVTGVRTVVGAPTNVVANNRFKSYLTNSDLTVANGTATVTLMNFYGNGVGGVQFHVNCAYGANAFKINATPGSQLTVWIEEYTASDANFRRINPDDGRCKIRTTDALDVLIVSGVSTVGRFRLRAALDVAPTATVDLDVTLVVNKEF